MAIRIIITPGTTAIKTATALDIKVTAGITIVVATVMPKIPNYLQSENKNYFSNQTNQVLLHFLHPQAQSIRLSTHCCQYYCYSF